MAMTEVTSIYHSNELEIKMGSAAQLQTVWDRPVPPDACKRAVATFFVPGRDSDLNLARHGSDLFQGNLPVSKVG